MRIVLKDAHFILRVTVGRSAHAALLLRPSSVQEAATPARAPSAWTRSRRGFQTLYDFKCVRLARYEVLQ